MLNKKSKINDDVLITNAEKLNTKEENAIIKLKTIYHGQDGDDQTELLTKGIYRKKGNLSQIVYQDSEATGFYDCETKLTANGNDSITILRRGHKVGSDLIVQCNKKLYSKYDTPMGSICIGITGSLIDNHLNENGGSLNMKYTIDMNGSLVSENEITITVELIQ